MKTIVFAVLAALVVAALPTTATHGEPDGDPFPDDAEHIACGFPAIQNLVNMLPPDVVHCDPGTADLQAGVIAPPPPCDTCEATDLVNLTGVPVFPGFPVPPVVLPPEDVESQGEELGVLEAGYDPVMDWYCMIFTPTGDEPFPVCVDLGPVSPLMPTVEPTPVGTTPEVPAGSILDQDPDDLPAVSVDVHIEYHHDNGRLNQRALAGDFSMFDPVDYDQPEEVMWWLGNGTGTSIVVTLVPYVDDAAQDPLVASTPFAGQMVAAINATQETLPPV